MDTLTRKKRSWNMSRIRGKDTKPELVVRSFLHRRGFRYSKNVSSLPGKPDIVFSKYRTVVFVHGCFWHRHRGCKDSSEPKSRKTFWKSKFLDNVKRFKKVKTLLEKSGWKIVVIWECEAENIKKLSKLLRTLKQSKRAKR